MTTKSALVAVLLVITLTAIATLRVLAAPLLPQSKPATRDVCPGLCDYTSIQAAIADSSDGDTIRVAGAVGSVYAEHLIITKSVQILGGYSGPPLWQRNIAAYPTTIDGQNLGPVVSFAGNSMALLEGFTIRGGDALIDGGGVLIEAASPTISATTIIGNNAASSGGGIAIYGGAPRLLYNTIVSNTAYGGGGILVADGSNAEIRHTTIASNISSFLGGGILVVNMSSPTIESCLIRANRASSGGGGVHAIDSLGLLTNSQIVENSVDMGYGGGVSLSSSQMTLQGSMVISNTAALDGGGIMEDNSAAIIDGVLVQGNRARRGGGMYLQRSLGVITNNDIIANIAETGSGGGVFLDHSAPTIDANSILDNSAAENGGGVEISGLYCASEVCDDPLSTVIVNTVIARNAAGNKGGGVHVDTGSGPNMINNTIVLNQGAGVFIDAYAQAGVTNTIVTSNTLGLQALIPSAPSGDYNIVWANTPGGDYEGMVPGLHDMSADPRFMAPTTNDYHLRADSPAIDRALTIVAPGSDRDGNVRPLAGTCFGPPVADIGAYEFLLDPAVCATVTPTTTPPLSPTATPTPTSSPTASPTRTATATHAATPTSSATPSPMATASPTPTSIATATATRTASPTGSVTPTVTVTRTATSSPTLTATISPTMSTTSTPTRTSTVTPTATTTHAPTFTPTPTPTYVTTPFPTPTLSPTVAPYRVIAPIVVANFLHDCALYEPNDTIDRAWGPLVLRLTYISYLCFFDPVDWYYVDLPRAGALGVDLLVPDRMDLNLFVHGSNGHAIAESSNFGEGVDEHIITVVQTPGRYYIRVAPYTRRDPNQPYELRVSFY